jgi:hypothetical protein
MSAELSQPEKAALTTALARALSVAASARSADSALFFQFVALRDDPNRAPTELRELLDVVSATPALEFFSRAEQVALGNREHVSFRFLSQWLVARAQDVGSDQAIEDLIRYLKLEAFEVSVTLAVDGVVVDRKIELADYAMVPWRELPNSDSKRRIAVQRGLSSAMPTAAIVQMRTVKPVHVRPWGPRQWELPPSIEPMLDVLRCVTAIAGAGIRQIEYWFEPPSWAPWVASRVSFGVDASILSPDVELRQPEQARLVSCVARLLAKSDNDRRRLRVPLDRLNRSHVVAMRSVDCAIELGVALEALFAPSKLSEGIGFAVRTRAARFLGGTFEERRTTLETVRDLYDLRSLAVHAGRFDTDSATRKWRDETKVRVALKSAQGVIARSLVKVIEEGEPFWPDFDIDALQT